MIIKKSNIPFIHNYHKSKGFAAGCSREVIQNGADMPGLSLDDLIQQIMDVLKIFRHNKCYSKDIVEV